MIDREGEVIRVGLLETSALSKSFGELTAVDEVSLNVDSGEVHSVIGPNGAGKSTLFNLVTGLHKPDSGQVFFQGEEITGRSAHEIARLGIVRSFQHTDVFDAFDVFENARLAVQAGEADRDSLLRRAEADDGVGDRTRTVLERIDLDGLATQPAADLSYGDRRRLEIGLTIASDPQLVLLDEPTAGMGSEETRDTIELIRSLVTEDRVTVILIEHNIEFVMDISDTITVLYDGHVVKTGDPQAVRSDDAVQRAYLQGVET